VTLRRLLLGVALVTGFAASAAADWIPFDRLPNADKV
jgi:hypothetical protein